MKKIILVTGCFLLLCHSCLKQQGASSYDYAETSGFDPEEIDSLSLVNLTTLCKVWGYVKYYHPVFMDNKLNIDYELFNLLPQIVNCSAENRNKILTEWINGLGNYEKGHQPTFDNQILYADYQTDIKWIEDSLTLGRTLSRQLIDLRYANRSGGSYYVSYTQYNNFDHTSLNPCFKNENPYIELSNPDYGYRLLSVFRFWNMVEYFFPCKYMTDKRWSDVLPEYITRMHTVCNEDYKKTLWSLIAQINDSHADLENIRLYLFGENRVPIQLSFAQEQLYVSAPDTLYIYTKKGSEFQLGDQIISVNGKPVKFYLELVKNSIPCSNMSRVKDLTTDIILRTTQKNTSIPIRYCRNEVLRDTLVDVITQRNYLDRLFKPFTYKIIDSETAYINPANYDTSEKDKITSLLADYSYIIIDFRLGMSFDFNNDYDANLSSVNDYTEQDSIEEPYLYTYPIIDYPGTFGTTSKPKRSKIATTLPTPKFIVLVGGWTQSAVETYVQCLQTRTDVWVIGTQSAGADGNISPISLPGGVNTCFSGLGWYYPDGTPVQRIGVKIDRIIEPAIMDIKTGRDELIDEAIRIIKHHRNHQN